MSPKNPKKPKKTEESHNPIESAGERQPEIAAGSLVLPDQALPPNLFVLPIQSSVVFPTLIAPITVSIPRFVATVEEAINRERTLGLLLVKEKEGEKVKVGDRTRFDDLYDLGVAVKVLKRLKLPDGSVNLLVHSVKRFRVKRSLSETPHLVAEAQYIDDHVEQSTEMDALTRAVISHVKKLSETNPFFTEEMRLAMINAPGKGNVADLVAFALSLNREQAQEFLETIDVKERFEKLLIHLKREQDVSELQKKISEDVNSRINSMQRDFFLKEQLKAIKKELGVEEDDKSKSSRTFRERIEAAGMPEATKKHVLEELTKFETLSEQSPEYNVARNYLELVCSLPWSEETKDNLDLDHGRKILDSEHYGLEHVKDRIIEFLAVRQLRAESEEKEASEEKDGKKHPKKVAKGSILCLVGPPGVGKTSIGRSIANTIGRNFYRFSLGGMRDEAEIKGHRRTYIGAMPGKIIQAIKRAETKNPVLMLDEIDKLGQSYQGDPASALLEVLDPEQNHNFLDHYLDVPFDLSDVLFVATANTLSTIPAPLLDRMEVIEIAGYTIEEKEKIAEQYVIPQVLKKNGIKSSELKIQKSALRQLLSDYSREPGLRSLQQFVERIARKAAAEIVRSKGKKGKKPISIAPEELVDWVGPKRFYNEAAERITSPGVVTGLAWTATGGDILFIEATDHPGGGQLKLTGNLGDVMTESASIALTFVKNKLARERGYRSSIYLPSKEKTEDFFKGRDLHIHVPSGAVPKDGPSAGVTIATAIYSLLTGQIVRNGIAMTGELSLTGKVLPVGGIKEKILAAKRAGLSTVVLPKLNEKDLPEVPKYALKDMTVHFASHVEEVFELAFSKAALPKPRSKPGLTTKKTCGPVDKKQKIFC